LPVLKISFMLEEYENKRRRQVSSMRSLMDYTMGIVIIALGALLFFHDKFKIGISDSFSPNVVKVLGVIFAVYGAWRIYRGYKKNYFQ
jgi:threonine/homoserine/homoserine lactone efflux protein